MINFFLLLFECNTILNSCKDHLHKVYGVCVLRINKNIHTHINKQKKKNELAQMKLI